MHLIICNERLLFRFGVDRVLLLLAQGLKARGWRVTFVAQRLDHQVLERIGGDILQPEPYAGPYLNLDTATAEWLAAHRDAFVAGPHDTVALIGGWPFYSAVALFRQWGIPVVALDCGGVPFDNLQGPAREVQERLRSLRREYLPEAQVVTPISDFIARTQSQPDAGSQARICTIHLGADHLDQDAGAVLWSSAGTGDEAQKSTGEGPFILNLGRWETGNYKNSEALFPLARRLLQQHPGARIGVLATAEELLPPEDLQACFVPLGHPDDAAMARIMARADLGLSVSLWEGFNLPLAEMQRLYRPVLAFRIGAHPEVAAHPDQLCDTAEQMIERALAVLDGQLLQGEEWRQAVDRFRDRFTWGRTVDAYAELLGSLAPVHDLPTPRLVVDASACLRDPANTGVARVVRSLSRKLQALGQPLFVAWDEQAACYVLPTEDEYRNLGAYGGPEPSPAHYRLPRSLPGRRLTLAGIGLSLEGAWLLQGEIVFERQGPERRRQARALGMKVAAIFYDAIPVTHPQYVADLAIRDNHAAYMNGLAECDRVLPISPDAGRQLLAHWQREGVSPHAVVEPCWIPGELTAAARANTAPAALAADQVLRLLCVSTLEPRKNHRTLLAALRLLDERYPQLRWRLDLVGNRYAGAQSIADEVSRAGVDDKRIVWHGVVDDQHLNALYAGAHLTLYPSLVEGYGMPIVESLWHARPCLCHVGGVMAELAADGGCHTVDMNDPSALADAIASVASDPAYYTRLAEQAVSRPILTWRSYARALLDQLARHTEAPAQLPGQWQHLLVPEGLALVDNPDQVALAALLARLAADSAILLGEHPGWLQALLVRQVAQAWLLDTSCTQTPGTLDVRDGLSCLCLPVATGLPLLAAQLARSARAPALILLGDGLADLPAILDTLRRARASLDAGVLVLVAADCPSAAFSAVGLSVCIRLPGLTGYRFEEAA